MAALKTHKRRPVAPTKDTQRVTINNIATLKSETTVEAYHTLFMNIELLMSSMLEHGVEDETIMIINSARLAQHERDIARLDIYLHEVKEAAKRFHEESDRIANKAEAERYSPEATVVRLKTDENPRRLRPPETGMVITLTVTARLSHGLLDSQAKILKAEQVYGPFWTLKTRCFIAPRNVVSRKPGVFVDYMATKPKMAARDLRLLQEYKLAQSTYRDVDIYMLVDLPRLVALRDTKILELGISTKEQMRAKDMEDRLPIIEKAELFVSRLPKTVSPESRRYIVHRFVEMMLLDNKKTNLQRARYARDGQPKSYNAANTLLAQQRFRISQELADQARIPFADMHKAIVDRRFSTYSGLFLRMFGVDGWKAACARYREWQHLLKLSEA